MTFIWRIIWETVFRVSMVLFGILFILGVVISPIKTIKAAKDSLPDF